MPKRHHHRFCSLESEDDLTAGSCSGETLLSIGPVGDVPKCLRVIALDVEVVEVESVLPHIQLDNWNQGCWDVGLLIVKLHGQKFLSERVPSQDGPTRTLNAKRGGFELSTEKIKGAKVLVDRQRVLRWACLRLLATSSSKKSSG